MQTQHTAHSTQHTAHSTQHTAHSTQHTAHSTQHFKIPQIIIKNMYYPVFNKKYFTYFNIK